MTTQPTQDAIVSQRDREVAADIWRDYAAQAGEGMVERDMRGGAIDFSIPSVLATYRTEIEAATIERCAGVAQERKDEWERAIIAGVLRVDVSKPYAVGAMREAGLLALNLRNLKGQTSGDGSA